jgi:hypothetical protein
MQEIRQLFLNNEIKPLRVSANDGLQQKATNASYEMLNVHYVHVLSCKCLSFCMVVKLDL